MEIGLPAVQDEKGLQLKKKESSFTLFWHNLPEALPWLPLTGRAPGSSSTGRWTKPESLPHPWDKTGRDGVLQGQRRMSVCRINVTEHVMESPHRCHNVPVINKGSAWLCSLDTQRLKLNSVSAFSPSAQTQQKGWMNLCLTQTYGDIRGAVRLQEAVKVLPGLGDPVDDLNQVIAPRVLIDLRLYQLPPQETAEETFDRLGVVCAQHPPTPGTDDRWWDRSKGAYKSAPH